VLRDSCPKTLFSVIITLLRILFFAVCMVDDIMQLSATYYMLRDFPLYALMLSLLKQVGIAYLLGLM
jgi:hypothetical protein